MIAAFFQDIVDSSEPLKGLTAECMELFGPKTCPYLTDIDIGGLSLIKPKDQSSECDRETLFAILSGLLRRQSTMLRRLILSRDVLWRYIEDEHFEPMMAIPKSVEEQVLYEWEVNCFCERRWQAIGASSSRLTSLRVSSASTRICEQNRFLIRQ